MERGGDSIDAFDGEPSIVHISDIHGYLSEARSALRAVGETDRFDSVVTTDENRRLHWADNNYVLVVNGDLIDRGPANEECLDLVWRLIDEAPPGRVRYHIGNHEMGIFLPELLVWPRTFSTSLDDAARREFLERVPTGELTAVFEGYQYQYSHAGRNEPFSASDVNDELAAATDELLDVCGTADDEAVQERVEEEYDRLFGIGERGGRGPDAGMCWMDFEHLEASAPPQIVGHSMQSRPVRKGNVVCGNIIRQNEGRTGGEGVLIEEPDELWAVLRTRDGGVETTTV